MMRLYFFLVLCGFFLAGCGSGGKLNKSRQIISGNSPDTKPGPLPIDTLEGLFFYEVNVPEKAYTKFDQVEQSNKLIPYDSLIYYKNIEDLYEHGVYIFHYESIMGDFINERRQGIARNKVAIQKLDDSVCMPVFLGDSAYLSNLYFDKSRSFSYKKIYAKLAVVNLGRRDQLIPKADNYRCCYSNRKGKPDTYFIVDVLESKLY